MSEHEIAGDDAITAAYAMQALAYCRDTGSLHWKVRPREHFSSTQAWGAWNTKYAGKSAGYIKDDGYVSISLGGADYKAHRLAFLIENGEWPPEFIDHVNGGHSDNRGQNLRPSTNSQNQMNRGVPANNKSGFKGVSWHKRSKKWRAALRYNGRQIHLGHFDTPEEAHAAYVAAATELFGEFARAA